MINEIEVLSKQCRTCLQVKPLASFDRAKDGQDGYRQVCKSCRAVARLLRVQRQKEEAGNDVKECHTCGETKQLAAGFYTPGRNVCKECIKKYVGERQRTAHAKRVKAVWSKQEKNRRNKAAYQKTDRGRANARAAMVRYNSTTAGKASRQTRGQNRRARVYSAPGQGLSPTIWTQKLARFEHCCAYCRSVERLTMDHVEAISRGGEHSENNVVPACASCNTSKHNKFLLEWAFCDITAFVARTSALIERERHAEV